MDSIIKISVIIPIYNAKNYLKECLDSHINQTLKEIEIILVLDCPTDGSVKIAEEYAQKDERIKLI
ncbi:MAG: glycosyltransferase, partial [Odoribacter sp.]